MSFDPGTHLGPYEILSALGAGGMGEVYRARDTRLKRDVALKILPASFASDADRLARFQREAEVLASLNHSNIAAIHGLEESDGIRALVMELVDGETLADRIARGPIPIDETLQIAKQIAEALEAAHEQGIIHRDLKPSNIKVTPNGVVKVLDFGLAKLASPAEAGHYNDGSVRLQADLSMSPTITSPAMTGVGVILGTAAYMSPEQARGKATDRRSDMWAFGCVLYEMLTGTRAFASDEVTDTLAFVVTKDPDWSALPAATPPSIRKLLRRCLDKDRKRRLPDAGSSRLELDEALTAPPNQSEASGASNQQTPIAAWRRSLPWIVAAGALVIGGSAVWVSAPWRTAAPPLLQRLSVELGADVSLLTDQGAAAILSPDGQTLAFVAQPSGATLSQLYVRRLAELQPKALNGAEGARDPFFSPNGQWIGFFAGGKLKKISVGGGSAVTLADAAGSRGATWTDDDSIVFQPTNARNGPLMRLAASGGMPQQLTTLVGDEVTHRWPQMLPGGKVVLFTAHNTTANGYEDANIIVQSLVDGSRKTVVRGGYFARYVRTGHLLYIHEGTVFAAPFDVSSFALKGQPTPVLDGVATNSGIGGAQFAFSNTGSSVYVQGSRFDLSAPILWMDRKGATSVLRRTPALWNDPQFSPDGRFLAINIRGAAGASDIWIYDLGRDALSRLTFGATNQKAVWTPDGRHVAFSSKRVDGSSYNIYWQRADGTGEVQRLTDSKDGQLPGSWHPSGRFLAFDESVPGKSNDLMILPMEGNETSGWKPGKPYVFLSTPASESEPVFSPDGRWLAYASNESNLQDVYVRPFPGPGGKSQISTEGGNYPSWSRTGRELFYRTPDGRLMVVSYTVEGGSFRADKPRTIGEIRRIVGQGSTYALHPDSQRFAIAAAPQDTDAKQDKVVFILNFFDELRRLAPAH